VCTCMTAVEYVEDYKLKVRFNNGIEGVVDLEPELYGEIFEPLRDTTLFRRVFLTNRTLEWPNGADFATEFLLEITQPKHTPEVRKVHRTVKSPTKKLQSAEQYV
jgi:hypothetical protein